MGLAGRVSRLERAQEGDPCPECGGLERLDVRWAAPDEDGPPARCAGCGRPALRLVVRTVPDRGDDLDGR